MTGWLCWVRWSSLSNQTYWRESATALLTLLTGIFSLTRFSYHCQVLREKSTFYTRFSDHCQVPRENTSYTRFSYHCQVPRENNSYTRLSYHCQVPRENISYTRFSYRCQISRENTSCNRLLNPAFACCVNPVSWSYNILIPSVSKPSLS